ncbi:MAG: 5-bromo-4-chloroindolyl phosphate hydrolysis family protein, partial [Oscillospiraceae bacterium]
PTPKQKRPFCNRKVKHDKLIGGLLQGFGVFYGIVSLIAVIILLFTVSESFIPAIIAAAIFLIFNGMAKNGRSLSKRAKRFERYMEFIGNNKMCEISALANYIGKSVGFVKKDLKKMIEQGYFAQAYMDRERTCIFLDRAAFDAYMGVFEKPKAKPETEEKPEEKPEEEPVKENANSDMMAEGRAAIEQLETLRSEIKSQTICEEIQKLENTAAKIFAYVGDHPNKAGEIRKLMRYYIPTTIKLLTTYREMEAQNISGETIEATMKDIDGVLTTIDTAFINLLDNMFRQDALDVAAEINVMNNMMAQEGLKKSDLEVSRESVKTAQSTDVKADEDNDDDIK